MYTQRRRKRTTKKGGGGNLFTRRTRTMPFRTRVKSAWQTTKQRLFPCCRQLKTAEAECDRRMEGFGQTKTTYINDLKTKNETLTKENKILHQENKQLLQENNQLLQFMSKLPDLQSGDASPPTNSTSRRR